MDARRAIELVEGLRARHGCQPIDDAPSKTGILPVNEGAKGRRSTSATAKSVPALSIGKTIGAAMENRQRQPGSVPTRELAPEDRIVSGG